MDWHLLINDISHMSERKAHDEMLIDYSVSIISGFFSGKKGGQHHDEVICAEAFFFLGLVILLELSVSCEHQQSLKLLKY